MSTDNDVQHIDELPITLRYSNAALEMGFTPVPRLFLWFYPYLRGLQGEALDPREAFFLQYIIAEKTGPDNPMFRLSQLPCPFSNGTRRRYASKIRAMGLVYSKAHYATTSSRGVGYKHPPATHITSVEWIMDPLFHNLSLVHAEWQKRREALKARTGKPRVFYRLPDDYAQVVVVPPHLVEAVALEKFYRLNPLFIQQARELLSHMRGVVETSLQLPLPSGESVPTEIPSRADLSSHGIPSRADLDSHGIRDARNPRFREIPSRAESARVLIESSTKEEEKEKDAVDIISEICDHFADTIGAERYEPTEKERRRLVALLADGRSTEEICQTITRVVERERARSKSVRSIAYCLPAVVDMSKESGKAEPEAGTGTPQPPVVRETPPAEAGAVTPAPILDELASGDAEMRDLLVLVQERNPERVLRNSDVRAWLSVGEKYSDLATTRGVTVVGLLNQAVLHGIGAQSDREGFFTATLAEAILESWQKEGARLVPAPRKSGNTAGVKTPPTTVPPAPGTKYPTDGWRFVKESE